MQRATITVREKKTQKVRPEVVNIKSQPMDHKIWVTFSESAAEKVRLA